MSKFITAGENLLNVDELLYVVEAKNKQLYIAQFKRNVPSTPGMEPNDSIFLSKAEFKDLLKNLEELYKAQ